MKRGRKRKGSNTSSGDKELNGYEYRQNQNFGICITDLPSPISVEILTRLPVKRILVCKCVCKTWHNLISDTEFAKLHFVRAEASILIRCLASTRVSRTLYLVEPPEFDLMCDRPVKSKLVTKLKIPMRDEEWLIGSVGKANMNLHSKAGVKLRPKDHELNIVNSCNGFLCLSEPSLNNPLIVCNPITGEFINLPAPIQSYKRPKFPMDCGLGFSPKANLYKVIRIHEPMNSKDIVAEIHTLGTGSWTRIGNHPSSLFKIGSPTYLNRSLHWICSGDDHSNCIMSFDLDTEKFQLVPPPLFKPGTISLIMDDVMALGVLGGCLCICEASGFEKLKIWAMKEYGVQGSWSQDIRLYTQTNEGRWIYGVYEPISFLRNGAIQLFHRLSGSLLYHEPKKRGFKLLKLKVGIKSNFDAIAYIPSLISLKDAVKGGNLAVLNTKSRCAEFKLQGENKDLFLVEVDPALKWFWF